MKSAVYNSTNARTIRLPGGGKFEYGPRQRAQGGGQVGALKEVLAIIERLEEE